MNRKELKHLLDDLNVDSREYSLENELLPDRIVLYNSYNDWNVFYFDERGGKNGERKFSTESEACQYIYQLFKRSK